MKKLIYILLLASFNYGNLAHADGTSFFSEPDSNKSYSQVLAITAGPFQPKSFNINNGNYSYNYGKDATQSVLVEAGWTARLFWLAGGFYINENLAYSSFNGTATNSSGASDNLNLNLLGLDSRFGYAMEWFPIKWLIPFAEGGYQFSFYNQTGSNSLESVQGSIGDFVVGAGLRIWLNKAASADAIPVFAIVKWNRIYSSSSDINFDTNSYMAGLGIGL